MSTVATVVLDDVDVTEFCTSGSVTHRLNRIGTASVTINMSNFTELFGTFIPGPGSYLKIYLENTVLGTTPVLWHHGRVLNCETTADQDTGYTVFNSSDPLELWAHRPVRDDDGSFAEPTIITDYLFAPDIVEAMVRNSECDSPTPLLSPPEDCEGPTRLVVNNVAAGQTIVPAAPQDWPMTMAQLASLLVSTGLVDIIVTPIEFDADDNYGQLDLYNGDYGQDLTSTVAFQYGMGAYNIRSLRWNQDMSNVANKIWYYLGPRNDDGQHWGANIQGQDPAFNAADGTFMGAWATLNVYAQFDIVTNVIGGVGTFYFICAQDHVSTSDTEPGVGPESGKYWAPYLVPSGGRSVDETNSPVGPPWDDNQVGEKVYFSRYAYDVRMDIQVFDGANAATDFRDMYRIQWQRESWLRAAPRELVHITPTRDTGIGEFDVGDLVLVEATDAVKGGFSGAQRIYEYTISWDADESVCWIGELQVSSDNEGFDT